MNYIVSKRINGKSVYMSASGKWVKSKRCAAVHANRDSAANKAKELQAVVDVYIFRN